MAPPPPQTNFLSSVFQENMQKNAVNDAVMVNQEDGVENHEEVVLDNQEEDDDVYEYQKKKDEYFSSIPQGYKFRPEDHQLIVHYLANKISNQPLPLNLFHDVELYSKSPAILTGEYKSVGENEWYFFTQRNRKYPNGKRPNREAGNGYWKASGVIKSIFFNKTEVGSKRALAYYEGKSPGGIKTNWIMHEYTIQNAPKRKRIGSDHMKLDDWVLCRVKKSGRVLKSRDDREENDLPVVVLDEPRKQTPILPVSVNYETSPLNHQNQEQSLMLPNQPELLPDLWSQEQILMCPGQGNMLVNQVNQMEHFCSTNYDQGFHNHPQYQYQQQQFVPMQYGFQDQQITTMHGKAMMLQSGVNSNKNDQIQSQVENENQQSQLRNDDEEAVRNDEYDSEGFEELLKLLNSPIDYKIFTYGNTVGNNVDQFFDKGQINFNLQQSPSASKTDQNF